jgi:Ca2+-binding RTX toxin-like protein
MANNITISNILDGIPEDSPIGTEVATILLDGVGVSITSATIKVNTIIYPDSPFDDPDYIASDAFEIVGSKIVLKGALDYDWTGEDKISVEYSFSVVATLSDGSTVNGYVRNTVTDVMEELRGTGRADDIRGTIGMDNIIAGPGNDQISGSEGNDIIYAGTGGDKMFGGWGNDTFVYKALNESTVKNPDIIWDWEHQPNGGTRDRIDLHEIDARTDYSGNQPFKWLGSKSFDGKKGELRYTYDKDSDRTHIYADVNGDRKADFDIVLDGNHKMYADDFFL